MVLSTACERFLESLSGARSPATVQWYRFRLAALRQGVGDMRLDAVTVSDLRRWRARSAARGLSPWTVHGYVRAARRLFAWLVQEGLLNESPASRLELPALPDEPPKALDLADLARLLAAARGCPRDYAIVCMLADTACRVGGLVGLELGDLDLGRGRALVREKGRGGRRKARTVYLLPETVGALREWLDVRPAASGQRVFVGQRGPLTTSGVYQVLRRLAGRAGVQGRWNPHSFRHGWARAALMAGADLGTVADVLGHVDIAVTRRFYARWGDDELRERHGQFSPMSRVGDMESSG